MAEEIDAEGGIGARSGKWESRIKRGAQGERERENVRQQLLHFINVVKLGQEPFVDGSRLPDLLH